MKKVVRVKLRVTPEQSAALSETLLLANRAANVASEIAFERRVFRRIDLRNITYEQVKGHGLGAQVAQNTIRKVADAYTTVRANARAGNYGRVGSKRWTRAMGKPVRFRDDAAHPFDDRCLSWQHLPAPDRRTDGVHGGTVSIWTTRGRLKGVPFVGNPEHLTLLQAHRQGETDLVHHDGGFFLMATIDLPDPPLREVSGFLGVDLGIANIAATSDGTRHSGAHLNSLRRRNLRLRKKLQAKGTRSATRLLRHRREKEARFTKNTNHVISKQLVTEAERTGRGIALENLTGIRDRVRLRKPQRVTFHSWAFAELAQFLAYKAAAAGVPIVYVNPAYTSQQCSECHHVARSNRPDQASFACRSCGVSLHADNNAGRNIAHRGEVAWGIVNCPHVTCSPTASGEQSHKPSASAEGG